jgi:hypothetical protein
MGMPKNNLLVLWVQGVKDSRVQENNQEMIIECNLLFAISSIGSLEHLTP